MLIGSITLERDLLHIEIAKDHPWTGTGLGTFYTAFPQYRNEKISLFYDHAHNDIAEFASELGIIGLTPLALIWILSLIKSIRVQRERRSQLMKAMGFASTMAMISAPYSLFPELRYLKICG